MPDCNQPSDRVRAAPRAWLPPVVLGVIFVSLLVGAARRDAFKREWFRVHPQETPAAECVAVLPKTVSGRLPVVIYFHGSGGKVLGSGNDLRAIAELGIAAVGMDYCQTNTEFFNAQFGALLDRIQRAPWADTNRIAWLGYSLGAQRQLSYLLTHSARRPALLARLGGGKVPELIGVPATTFQTNGSQKVIVSAPGLAVPKGTALPSILIVHGDQEEVFPIGDAHEVEAALHSAGAKVEFRTMPGKGHSLGEERAMIFREIGEYVLRKLKGADAFKTYRSIHQWQASAPAFWCFLVPGIVLGGIWVIFSSRCSSRREEAQNSSFCASGLFGRARYGASLRRLLRGGEEMAGVRSLWGVAIGVGVLAFANLGFHMVVPEFQATSQALGIARRFLIPSSELGDFDYLAAQSSRQTIGTLRDHAHLANYNRKLVEWKVDDSVYREYVLSTDLGGGVSAGDLAWRRTLWEAFYPRIRKAPDAESAAKTIKTQLRARVTVADGDWPQDIAGIWSRQITDEKGFAAIYTAALRSCGVPARLASAGKVEIFAGGKWGLAGTRSGPSEVSHPLSRIDSDDADAVESVPTMRDRSTG